MTKGDRTTSLGMTSAYSGSASTLLNLAHATRVKHAALTWTNTWLEPNTSQPSSTALGAAAWNAQPSWVWTSTFRRRRHAPRAQFTLTNVAIVRWLWQYPWLCIPRTSAAVQKRPDCSRELVSKILFDWHIAGHMGQSRIVCLPCFRHFPIHKQLGDHKHFAVARSDFWLLLPSCLNFTTTWFPSVVYSSWHTDKFWVFPWYYSYVLVFFEFSVCWYFSNNFFGMKTLMSFKLTRVAFLLPRGTLHVSIQFYCVLECPCLILTSISLRWFRSVLLGFSFLPTGVIPCVLTEWMFFIFGFCFKFWCLFVWFLWLVGRR